jgi:hypothetical protein
MHPQTKGDGGFMPSEQESLATVIALIDHELATDIARRPDSEKEVITLFDTPLMDIVARYLVYRRKYKKTPGRS